MKLFTACSPLAQAPSLAPSSDSSSAFRLYKGSSHSLVAFPCSPFASLNAPEAAPTAAASPSRFHGPEAGIPSLLTRPVNTFPSLCGSCAGQCCSQLIQRYLWGFLGETGSSFCSREIPFCSATWHPMDLCPTARPGYPCLIQHWLTTLPDQSSLNRFALLPASAWNTTREKIFLWLWRSNFKVKPVLGAGQESTHCTHGLQHKQPNIKAWQMKKP